MATVTHALYAFASDVAQSCKSSVSRPKTVTVHSTAGYTLVYIEANCLQRVCSCTSMNALPPSIVLHTPHRTAVSVVY